MPRAVVIDPSTPERLVLREVARPIARPDQALVRVVAFSLNRGELRRAFQSTTVAPIGWDFAGVVDTAAADGSGPQRGTRVVGLLADGAWAELIAAPTRALAPIPDAVSDSQAATLPVAGLTALFTLRKGGGLVGRRVLITGATGGVGEFALALARHGGARVIAQVRREEQAQRARDCGAHVVVVGGDERALSAQAPYGLVIESVGGETLAASLALLEPGATCVSFGISGSPTSTFDVRRFYGTGRVTLHGFFLFRELEHEPASAGLSTLLELVAGGGVRPHVTVEAPWTAISRVAKDLYERRLAGKVVLRVG